MTPAWLSNAIIYQIYPQSFQDSNGDGIGDFEGIAHRLGYLKQLGINTIWLNPCFDSPFGDAGYDVRDFYKTAPRYGSNDDLVQLIEAASEQGIRVILDLVAGHTSIEHSWFVESAKGADNPFANRYIWKNRDFDPADGPTIENFVHNFFPFQPALNFGYANPEEPWQDPVDAPGPLANRQALKDILAYWFDRGAAGFRVDMASSLVKNDEGFVETKKLWQEIRGWLDDAYPDRILTAEWSDPEKSIDAGYHLDFLMHFNVDVYRSLFFNGAGTLPSPYGPCYFDAAGLGTPHIFLEEYLQQLEVTEEKGVISLPTANHDFQRLRVGERDWGQLKAAWVFLLTQKGLPTIYYGDEIGMRFVPDTPSKEGSLMVGLESAGIFGIEGERAGTRTPMQWDNSKNAGFSTADPQALYLPLDPDENRPTVADQQAKSDSLFNFVRELINLRKSTPALSADASYQPLNPPEVAYPLVIQRAADENQSCLIVVNPAGQAVQMHLADVEVSLSNHKILLGNGIEVIQEEGGARIEVDGFGYAIIGV